MEKLVIDHTYALGMAWDKTKYRNHGLLHLASPGDGEFEGSMYFERGRTHPGSCIIIPPSNSLQNLGAIRVRARIYPKVSLPPGIDPNDSPDHVQFKRQNIVEADRCFAFFLEKDLSIYGTFLAPNNKWLGIKSKKLAVIPNRWSLVEFWYDGVSAAKILVNGQQVASSYDPTTTVNAGSPIGPVGSVGSKGIFIGHWPAASDQYTFNGFIREVQLYKRNEQSDLLKMLDPCCSTNLKEWYDLAYKLRQAGYDAKYWREIQSQLMGIGTELTANLRDSSEQNTQELNQVMRQLIFALINRRKVPLEPSLRQAMDWIAEHGKPEDLLGLEEKVRPILDKLPFSQDELLELAKKLCLDGLQEAADQVTKSTQEDPKWEKIRKKYEEYLKNNQS